MSKNKLKYELEIKALEKANDEVIHQNKSLIRQKTLYECEIDILCSRIEKAIKYSENKGYKKVVNILKGSDK